MKIRTGFVSNSSSSSFICDVCGEEASGYDMSLSDADMYQCENGHTYCRSEAKNSPSVSVLREYYTRREQSRTWKSADEIKAEVEKIQALTDDEVQNEDLYEDTTEWGSIMPRETCPMCMFEKLSKTDALRYLMKCYNLTNDIILQDMRGTFKDYDAFSKFLKNDTQLGQLKS